MKKKESKYYVATDLITMESEICCTMQAVSEFLHISRRTVERGLSKDTRIYKPNVYLICSQCTITKSKHKGNSSNLR